MRPLRIAVIATACTIAAGLAVLSVVVDLHPGLIDATAAHRIRKLCAHRADCDIRLHDILPGDWDTFQEFGPHQEQSDLDDALPGANLHASEMQRILVFKKDGTIQHVVYEDFGVEHPMHNEVDFEEEYRSPTPSFVDYTPQQQLRVTTCGTDKAVPFWLTRNGTYYMLTPLPLDPRRPPSC